MVKYYGSALSSFLYFGFSFPFLAIQSSYRSGLKYKVPQLFKFFCVFVSFFLYLQSQDTDSVMRVPALIDLLQREKFSR